MLAKKNESSSGDEIPKRDVTYIILLLAKKNESSSGDEIPKRDVTYIILSVCLLTLIETAEL